MVHQVELHCPTTCWLWGIQIDAILVNGKAKENLTGEKDSDTCKAVLQCWVCFQMIKNVIKYYLELLSILRAFNPVCVSWKVIAHDFIVWIFKNVIFKDLPCVSYANRYMIILNAF